MIDLVDFGGDYFVSLSSIHAVFDEKEDGKLTGVVFIEYGPHGARAGFEGTARDVMRVIAEWQRDNSPRAASQPLLASA